MPKLANPKHERFCQEYIIDLNGTKTYERTYGKVKAPRVQASKLLSKANISARIAELKEIRSERTVITQDMVLKELKILAQSDIQDYLEVVNELVTDGGILKLPDGRLKLKVFKEMKGGATRAIKSISEKINKDGIHLQFKLHGKTPALELLARHLGMLIERHELTGKDGKPIQIEYILVKQKKRKRGGDGKGDGKENSEANPGVVAAPGTQGAEAEK